MTAPELKSLDLSRLKEIFPGTGEDHAPNVSAGLGANRRHVSKQAKRLLARLEKTRNCLRTIERLPALDESIHCVLNGEYSLFDFIPAVLQLSGQQIDMLWASTLGFSKANVSALGELADVGTIQNMAIVCSCYFGAADKPILDQAVELCQKHGFRIAALRTHAKLLLIRTGDHYIVIESSANLRSCHNVEQATVFNDAALFEFHRTWMDEMLTKAGV